MMVNFQLGGGVEMMCSYIAVCRTYVIHEPCIWPSLLRVLRSSVARVSDQSIRKAIGTIPIGDSDFVFFPCS